MATTYRHARIVSDGMKEAADKLDNWSVKGLSGAVRAGLSEYQDDLQWAAHKLMKLPSKGRRGPLDVGLRWRKTRSFASKPEPTGRPAEWQIKVQPQYMALWQEHGIKPHVTFDPNQQRSDAFKRTRKRQDRAKARKVKLENIQNRDDKEQRRLEYAEKSIRKREQELRALQQMAGATQVAGYSDPSRIPRKNQGSDWFKGNVPTATTGRRAGQPRPVAVKAGQKLKTNKFVAPIRPIERAAIRIAPRHKERMAFWIDKAYREGWS